MPRLLHTGQVMIDLVMAVDKLPQPGGDVLAQSASFEAGGGFNVMAAARRNGLPVVYLGRHGNGRFGDLARAAMQAEGVGGMAQQCRTGYRVCASLTDASAERTFISHIGAEGELTAEDLASVPAEAGDYVYVSGYSLLHGRQGSGAGGMGAGFAEGDQRGVRPGPAGRFAGFAADAGVVAAHRYVDQQQR